MFLHTVNPPVFLNTTQTSQSPPLRARSARRFFEGADTFRRCGHQIFGFSDNPPHQLFERTDENHFCPVFVRYERKKFHSHNHGRRKQLGDVRGGVEGAQRSPRFGREGGGPLPLRRPEIGAREGKGAKPTPPSLRVAAL